LAATPFLSCLFLSVCRAAPSIETAAVHSPVAQVRVHLSYQFTSAALSRSFLTASARPISFLSAAADAGPADGGIARSSADSARAPSSSWRWRPMAPALADVAAICAVVSALVVRLYICRLSVCLNFSSSVRQPGQHCSCLKWPVTQAPAVVLASSPFPLWRLPMCCRSLCKSCLPNSSAVAAVSAFSQFLWPVKPRSEGSASGRCCGR
jgi:hypothetical protein